MKRYTCCLVLTFVLLGSQADAACVHADNQDLLEYSCEGGSVEDLKEIPSNVEKIRISHMPVRRITESLFAHFADNLLVFTCSYCLVSDIDDNAFSRLRKLQQVSLDNNHLTEVKGSWFQGLSDLTYLDLNYNNIERIDGNVFKNALELVDLRVSGNRLECLDLESMSKLGGLKRIFINENPTFGCPNAVKRFLNERHVDFEADPHWNNMAHDRVRADEPLPAVSPTESDLDRRTAAPTAPPTPPTLPPQAPRSRWTEEPPTIPTTPEPTPQPVTPPRRPYVPEMIQPSVPDQDFVYQTPYYAPKVTQQPLDNYRNTVQNATEEAKNKPADAVAKATTSPTVLVAGIQPQEPTTTECPNAAGLSTNSSLMILLALAAAMLSACRWTTGML